ncbi:MAG: zinc ribbon domain-containing protein [Chloroflexi bacterium]|nr:zinc ribbon domain-containing protein [Chloroflexota bacterium]
MPVYDYKCKDCGSTFEKLVRFSAKDKVACPCCGGVETKRQVSLPAVTLWTDHDGGRQKAPSYVPATTSGPA